jgi:type VI secretion system secreted protein VgrG
MLTIRIDQLRLLGDAMPNRAVVQPCRNSAHWIEFQLVNQKGAPVPDQSYRIRLPDQSLRTGTTDARGTVRFDGITAGEASICFTELDGQEWKAG